MLFEGVDLDRAKRSDTDMQHDVLDLNALGFYFLKELIGEVKACRGSCD